MPSHGSGADVVGNGYVLTSFLNSATFAGSRETAETTVFKKTSKTYIPGMKDTSMNIEGIFDGAVDEVDQVLQAAFDSSASGLYSYFPKGQESILRPAFTLDAVNSNYEVTTDIGDVAQVSAELSGGDKGVFARGLVVRPLAVAAAGGNSSSIDNTAQSLLGANLVVHAVASASLVVKLQDSADNVTFADLAGSISSTTGRSSQRLVVPGTIRRYTRVLWTGTGTFLAVVERN